ncbi:MAG TPA: hypothetical protein VG870_02850 [Chitinophagaceae bacterium]|nr:hypothetical protein [Chitinophagaceae bacterium]
MLNRMVNRLLLSFCFLLAVYSGYSQRDYFMYIQSESSQPFFVRMQETVYSSTASGYLILPRLRDSTYSFSLGFPGSQAGEIRFTCPVNQRDHGYLLKQDASRNWSLQDLQTGALIAGAVAAEPEDRAGKQPVSAFTELLSRAADDSTLREDLVRPEPPVAKTTQATNNPQVEKRGNSTDSGQVSSLVIKDTPTTQTVVVADTSHRQLAGPLNLKPAGEGQPDTTTGKPQPLATTHLQVATDEQSAGSGTRDTLALVPDKPVSQVSQVAQADQAVKGPFIRSRITRKSESSTTQGFGLVFLDENPDGSRDTISILIPNDARFNLVSKDTLADPGLVNQPSEDPRPATQTQAPNACHQVASEDDFFRLRKRMAAQKSDDRMLAEAEKQFRSICFSTEQVRNLSTLFLTSEGKYRFFDAAYGRVTDLENFPSLQSELRDAYFIKRFQAMLRN